VAIRSSGIGEDSETSSFAGLFATILGVSEVPSALAAAARCIASGRDPRVTSYAGVVEAVPVGLVVQRMVAPRAAGVLFTRDPAGQDPARVIEAAAGLGEAVVSGAVDPERWRVYRSGFGDLVARRTNPEGAPSTLSETEATALAAAGGELAEKWSEDLDLEWAIDADGTIWWLQARPITSPQRWEPPVVERSSPGADDGPVTVWSNWNVRESLPEPIPPLSWAILRASVGPMIARDMLGVSETSPIFPQAGAIDRIDGRVYFNMNALLAGGGMARALPRMLGFMDPRARATTVRLLAEGVLRSRRLTGGRFWRAAALWGTAGRGLSKSRLMFHPRRTLRELAEAGARIAGRPPVEGLNDAALLSEMRLFSSGEIGVLRDGLAAAIFAFFTWLWADWLFRRWPEARRMLVAGVEGNPTTQISVEIDALAESAGPLARWFDPRHSASEMLVILRGTRDPALRAWMQAFDAFLERNGHRGPQELDISVPRWGENPSMILELVRSGVRTPPREPVRERLARLRNERATLLRKAIAGAPFWRRPLMRRAAAAAAEYLPLREAPKHELARVLLRSRLAVLELGRRLAERDLLPSCDDVWLLDLDELVELTLQGAVAGEAPAGERIQERREQMQRFGTRRPADFLRSDGIPIEETAFPSPGKNRLAGVGVGGGHAEGPVRILLEPDASRLQEGEVLVVRFADPGWTPLFPRAAAVVMEVGGLMCHAAVIARELGIPAVVGVRGATQRLEDGMAVRVDGNSGEVILLDGAGE
jgi:phosphohistidine swiveling domain-containing protein